MQAIYVVFASTTGPDLGEFLSTIEHTRLNGTSVWSGVPLPANLIILFNLIDALALKSFLENAEGQVVVPIFKLAVEAVLSGNLSS